MSCLPRRRQINQSSKVASLDNLPVELLLQISQYSADSPVDLLSFSLVSAHFAHAIRLSLLTELPTDCSGPILDGYFRSLPFVRFSEVATFQTPAGAAGAGVSLYHYCRCCQTAITAHSSLETDQYHGSLGPAFLARATLNTVLSPTAYPVQYTTGHYRVADLRCGGCQKVLGRKYITAEDPSNAYKVGKVLLEATLVEVPQCCVHAASTVVPPLVPGSSSGSGSGSSSGSGSESGSCSRCLWWRRVQVARTLLSSTEDLKDARKIQWLWEALTHHSGRSQSGGLRRKLASLLWGEEDEEEVETLSMRLVLLDSVEVNDWRDLVEFVHRWCTGSCSGGGVSLLQRVVVNYFKVGKTAIKDLFYKLDTKEERTAMLSALAEVASAGGGETARCVLNELKKDIYVPSDSLANWLVCGRPLGRLM